MPSHDWCELPVEPPVTPGCSQLYRLLQRLSVGGLKSLLQKTIRFHAREVELPRLGPLSVKQQQQLSEEEETGTVKAKQAGKSVEAMPLLLPAGVVAAVATALLFTEPGTFSPELQVKLRTAFSCKLSSADGAGPTVCWLTVGSPFLSLLQSSLLEDARPG